MHFNIVFQLRSTILDQHRKDGETAARCSRGQHSQVPLSSWRQSNAHDEVAEKWQRVQAGASHWRL
jgi:hypothetical protein